MRNVNTTNNLKKRLTDGEIDAGITKIADALGEYPKKAISIPIIEGRPDAVEICYNGYVVRIKCGVSVDVPEPIYLILRQSGRLG